ncbi:MAG: hypothetical protein ACMG57_02900, partial [Candidatus Dojkabacteria bacterium]
MKSLFSKLASLSKRQKVTLISIIGILVFAAVAVTLFLVNSISLRNNLNSQTNAVISFPVSYLVSYPGIVSYSVDPITQQVFVYPSSYNQISNYDIYSNGQYSDIYNCPQGIYGPGEIDPLCILPKGSSVSGSKEWWRHGGTLEDYIEIAPKQFYVKAYWENLQATKKIINDTKAEFVNVSSSNLDCSTLSQDLIGTWKGYMIWDVYDAKAVKLNIE